jgi:hypothetical protein
MDGDQGLVWVGLRYALWMEAKEMTTFSSLRPYEIQFSTVIPEVQDDDRLELVMVSYFDTPKVIIAASTQNSTETTTYCYTGAGGKNRNMHDLACFRCSDHSLLIQKIR